MAYSPISSPLEDNHKIVGQASRMSSLSVIARPDLSGRANLNQPKIEETKRTGNGFLLLFTLP